jgi:type I restriction enzyme, S subunit
MNPDWLLKYFEQISEVPDAVPRLRRFILDLAVRGKLEEQDPADEPASELLKRIEAEKAQLYKEKGLHNPRRTPVKKGSDFPCEVPAMWKWCNLAEISLKIHYGYTASANPHLHEIRLLRITDIQNNSVHWDSVPGCEIAHEQADQYLLADGDILIARTGGTIGKSFLVKDIPVKAVFASYLIRVQVSQEVFDRYLKVFLESSVYWTQLENGSRGAGQPNVNGQTLGNMVVSLPPLAEQHRIVAKVDELMALCDELEMAQAKREKRRDRLVAAILHGLNNGNDSSEPGDRHTFEESARFYFNHLPRLTTRPEHIHQLRQTILNLAVRGKLVLQDPKDEPATELIRKIAVERLRLLQGKQIPAQKSIKPSEHFDNESKVPDSWQQCYLQDIAYQITDGTHLTPKYTDYGKPFLSAQNIKPFRFMPGNHRYVSERDFENYRSNRKPERGDILLTRVGAGIGQAAVLDADMQFAFYVSICLIKIPTHLFSPEFLVIWLNSPTGRSNSSTRTYGKGFSQGNLNLGLIRTFRVPVPPLAEQHRIVAKVNELLALCEELEARITTSTATGCQLLQATLSEALAVR